MGSKNILALIFYFTAFILLVRTVALLWNTYLADFSIFYQAVFVGFSKENPYLYKDFFAPFIYPPFFLLLMYPFSFFSFQVAGNVWLIFSIVLFLISIFLLRVYLHASYFLLSIVLLSSVISFPFKFTLGMGQVNMLLLCGIVVFLYFYNKKILLSSLFFYLATIVKIIPLIFLYPLILFKDYKTIGAIFFIFLLTSIISIVVFGYELHRYYLINVFPGVIFGGLKESYYNQSLVGSLSRFGLADTGVISQTIIGVFTGILLWMKKPVLIASVSLLITTVLLISSFAWQHHLVLLLIPFFYATYIAKNTTLYVILLLAYAFIAINIKTPDLFQNSLYGNMVLSHGTWGMIVLYSVLVFIIWKNKPYEK